MTFTNISLEFSKEEPLSKHTSFRVGGPAEFFARPKTADEFMEICHLCKTHDVPITILGDGTNVLVADTGLRGVVVTTSKMNEIEILQDGKIRAQAGTRLSKVAEMACKAGFSGFEFASGIPGTVGGAICMNAGAYGGEIGNFCDNVTLFDNKLQEESSASRTAGSCCEQATSDLKQLPVRNIYTKTGAEMKFGYRQSIVQQDGLLVLEAVFQLKPGGNPDEIKQKMNELNGRRRTTQPLDFPSAGSTFKRPTGYFAGTLIQDSGLKGFAIGGAQVSEKHAGFVINTGTATAQDIYNLIQAVQQQVFEKFDVWLEPEVKLLGF